MLILLVYLLGQFTQSFRPHYYYDRWSLQNFKGEKKIIITTEADLMRGYGRACPLNHILARCEGITKSMIAYVDYCAFVTRDSGSPKITLTCVPKQFYSAIVHQLYFYTGADHTTVKCPTGTIISDCRVEKYRMYVRTIVEYDRCIIYRDERQKMKYLTVHGIVVCLKTEEFQVENKLVKRNSQYEAVGTCPAGSLIFACKCKDDNKCMSTRVKDNTCTVIYNKHSSDVEGLTSCTGSTDWMISVVERSRDLYEYGYVTDCSIRVGPKSTMTYKEIKKKMKKIGQYTGCRVDCDDCEIDNVGFIATRYVAIGDFGRPSSCLPNYTMTHCDNPLESGLPYFTRCHCKPQSINNIAMATCTHNSSKVEIIYRKKNFRGKNSWFTGYCNSGEARMGCMLLSRIKTMKFYQDIRGCRLWGDNPGLITVCSAKRT